jgi:hypothetical protein
VLDGLLDGRAATTDIPAMNRVGTLLLSGIATCASMFGGACATTTEAGPVTEVAKASGAERLPDDSFKPDGFERRDLDLNKDGRPDAYQFVVVEGEASRVVRKEADVNFDGKIDVVRNLDTKGELVEERIDTDFDGRIDIVIAFQQGLIVKKTYDTNFDSKIDLWRTFEKGVIVKEEADLNYDGAVDFWEYYEGGILDRVGIDRNGDGNVDEWQAKDAT